MALNTAEDVVQYACECTERAANSIAPVLARAAQVKDEVSIIDLHRAINALSAVRDSLELLKIRLKI